MTRWKIYTPEGVQDILFDECYMKKQLEGRIREVFRKNGFLEVETPTIEFFDVFSSETDIIPQESMFKFFDQQGRILVLRPEMTIPVARISATKFKEEDYPLKFCYIGNAFKYDELGGGKQKEFTQAGVEIHGADTPEADAEVIATAISAVRAAGLKNFQIDIGQVEFFKGLMEETGLSEEDTEQVRVLIDRKDFLGVEDIVKDKKISSDLKELILSLPGLFGSVEVIDKVEKITRNNRSRKALGNLRQVLEILDDYGLGKYVSVDLGMVQSITYYTGVIFRGFTYGVGFPILSGGRYDNLLEKYGRKCAATGFSLGINMVMMAFERQKIRTEKPEIDTLVCYRPEGRKTAFALCNELRAQGLAVYMDVAGMSIENAKNYAKSRSIGGIIYVTDNDNIEVHNIETEEISRTSVQELLDKSQNR